jgi:hypothetical protein
VSSSDSDSESANSEGDGDSTNSKHHASIVGKRASTTVAQKANRTSSSQSITSGGSASSGSPYSGSDSEHSSEDEESLWKKKQDLSKTGQQGTVYVLYLKVKSTPKTKEPVVRNESSVSTRKVSSTPKSTRSIVRAPSSLSSTASSCYTFIPTNLAVRKV